MEKKFNPFDDQNTEADSEVSCSTSGLIPVPMTMKTLDPSNEREKRSLDEITEDLMNPTKKAKVTENRKIYIGNLPPSVTEKPLVVHFRTFGHVVDCCVVRDRDSGISRGFAFLTFMDESEADAALMYESHTLDGKPIRVSLAQKNPDMISKPFKKGIDASILDSITLPRFQVRVYIGPIDEDVSNDDIIAQLEQYGDVKGVSRIKSKKTYGLVDFKDPISVRRTFTNKIFIKA